MFDRGRRWIGILGWIALIAGTTIPAEAQDQPAIRLRGWNGPASLVENRGPGTTVFRLAAVVDWRRLARSDRGGLEARIDLPGGGVYRHPLRPSEGPGSRSVSFYVPVDAVRNRPPERVRVSAVLVSGGGAAVSNVLSASIAQFPTPNVRSADLDVGPFDWGRPLDPSRDGAEVLPSEGIDGWRFVRVFGDGRRPGFFIATREATNRQVGLRLEDYDPNRGRSDEFLLDDPEQPALNLTPEAALEYLETLSSNDPAGVDYRLPTVDEWRFAARAGSDGRFWWGDAPTDPEGANLFGPEPASAIDTTIPAGRAGGYRPNPWRLIHTFGNVAEWATDDVGRFERLGGSFRSDAEEAADAVVASNPGDLGPDPFVGVRPAFDLDAEETSRLIERRLADAGLPGIAARFDPERATATLTGRVQEGTDRRRALESLRSLWFLAALEDRIETPTIPPGQLVAIGGVVGTPRVSRVLGRTLVEVSIGARWVRPLPVSGSDWWINVYGNRGGHAAYRLDGSMVGDASFRASIPSTLIGPNRSVRLGLSLGTPSDSRAGASLVSDVKSIEIAR